MKRNAYRTVNLLLHLLAGSCYHSRVVVSNIHGLKCRHEIHVAFSIQPIEVQSLSSDNGELGPILRECWSQQFLSTFR